MRRRSGGKGYPCQGVVGGDGVDAALFEVADELAEEPAGIVQLESERAAKGEVVLQRSAKRWPGHRAASGQGRARLRSLSTSSLRV